VRDALHVQRFAHGLLLREISECQVFVAHNGFFDRLVAAGKPKMQAVGACKRKLVMICYGVLKTRALFDPNWGSQIAT
jgi:hypothetical protein